ncbi:MAG: C_GCAxxG_C_C family protein [Desulfovibrionaceae bacterium]|nr:C_GCAxxG_C_C family protein [Desulfovibrionaceae bacterium]
MKNDDGCGSCPSRRMFLKAGGAAGIAALLGAVACIQPADAAAAGTALEERVESVAKKFGSMSCAQALATTYADLVGLREEQAKALTSGFGLGMGRKQTCGSLTAGLMVLGLAGKGDACAALMNAFEKKMGSTQCAFFVDQFGYSRCRDLLRFVSRQLNERAFS